MKVGDSIAEAFLSRKMGATRRMIEEIGADILEREEIFHSEKEMFQERLGVLGNYKGQAMLKNSHGEEDIRQFHRMMESLWTEERLRRGIAWRDVTGLRKERRELMQQYLSELNKMLVLNAN
ncbi:hypothetical protein ACFL6S_16925 [Candidatus Poribacteria bacterium]